MAESVTNMAAVFRISTVNLSNFVRRNLVPNRLGGQWNIIVEIEVKAKIQKLRNSYISCAIYVTKTVIFMWYLTIIRHSYSAYKKPLVYRGEISCTPDRTRT